MRSILSFFVQVFILTCFIQCSSIEKKNIGELTYDKMSEEFKFPAKQYRPETWFHILGNNMTKEGMTLDLEAIEEAGLQGIHLFNKDAAPFPGIKQVKVLSPEWEEIIGHAATECQRLGLKFTMQNCPGWSMTGGPWVPVEEAQREIVESVYRVKGRSKFEELLQLNPEYHTVDFDYKDVQVIAFPTPEGDKEDILVPEQIESNNKIVPWATLFNPNNIFDINARGTKVPESLMKYKTQGIGKVNGADTWVKVKFDNIITLRSIQFSPTRLMIRDQQYPLINVQIKIQAVLNNELTDVSTIKIPNGSWPDRDINLTLAVPETQSKEFVFTFTGEHRIGPAIMHLSSKPRLHNHESKAAKVLRALEKEVQNNYSEDCIIKPDKIVELSSQMDETGKLSWDVPEGDWTVVRFGHINMRKTNKPAMPESTGWECSKLDKVAIENHLRKGMIGKMIQDGGPIGDGKLAGLLIDSWESGVPTWTMNSEDMFKEFEQRTGYSMKPYLPVTIGYIVESREESDKFLRDLRQVTDEVYIDNFFNHFSTVAHDMGAEVYTEGAGGEVLPVDPMRYYGVSDYPMTEFWYPKAPSNQNEYAKPIFSAASATHLYNKDFLSAEACTQLGVKWSEHPYSVKYLIDYNFTKGVSHLVFHTFSHTPQKEVYPGSSFSGSIGFPFVRQQTWWKHMPAFTDYLARCQYVLQQGEYAADVLWYYGDHCERPPFDLDYFPEGYRFDYLNAEILHEKLSVIDGKINVKDAGDYRVILLRDSKDMLLSTAQKLKELVMDGAVILGDKPINSPSLMDDENDVKRLKQIADELWGDSTSGVKAAGKGKVYWGTSLDEVLQAESIAPDVIVPNDLPISWIHRKTAEADIYFVSSTNDKSIDASISFRVSDAYPQLWDAFSGTISDAKIWSKQGDRINLVLSFDPSGSVIVVFPKGNKTPHCSKVTLDEKTLLSAEENWFRIRNDELVPTVHFNGINFVATHSGIYKLHSNEKVLDLEIEVNKTSLQKNWEVEFESGWDTPKQIQLDELKSLTEHEYAAIQHYSGTVIYTKTINVDRITGATILDLGNVNNIAELWLNSEKIGTRWVPPFTFDISKKVKVGANNLEIKVTNTWRNQLVYDNKRPEGEKKTWTSNPPDKSDTELELSGLVGPVVLKRME